ncbi:MAG TPA: type II secretion system F family protein [Marmoricola sp.]
MTGSVLGAAIGAAFGVGVVLVLAAVLSRRRLLFETRVLPYLRDLPARPGAPVGATPASGPSTSAFVGVFGPVLRRAADLVDRVLGGSASVRRRLDQAGLPLTVHDFRVEQVVWGLAAFVLAAVPAALVAVGSPQRAVPLMAVCLCCLALGVLLRENRLSAQVRRRQERMLQEFPTVAELLALAVAAGEGPVAALDRVVARAHGELAGELRRVLADVRTGTPVTAAFDDLAARSSLPVVARFAEGLAIAVERGTPLADVLHAQAADVREAGRRSLIEAAARKEITMMVPVVFGVLPVVVVFAFWPGLVGLHLVVP